MTNKPLPARVSDEAMFEAATLLGEHYIDQDRTDRAQEADHCKCGPLVMDWDMHFVEVLVSHGWGPRPTVSAAKLDLYITQATMGRAASASSAMREYLRECGIEVTDGD